MGEAKLHETLAPEIGAALAKLEKATGKTFGKGPNPLLVSVRSGAAVSMPGMMDTVLNLGLNPETVQAMIDLTKNPRFVWDSYRRFMQMFGNVVMGVEHHDFEHELSAVKKQAGVKHDTDLTAENLMTVVDRYKKVVKKSQGATSPFAQWNSSRPESAPCSVHGTIPGQSSTVKCTTSAESSEPQ